MRLNMSHYIKFIDVFAPCIVPVQLWKHFQKTFVTNGTMEIFTNTFSCSDEAFLLVVIINYETKWKAESANTSNLKVSSFVTVAKFVTTSNLTNML